MTSSPHVFIATPCFGGTVTQSYMQSVIGCMAEAGAFNLRLTLSMIGNDALITRARNTLLHQFLSMTDASHLLFVDADISFTAQDIAALLSANVPLIGAPYPLKAHYWDQNTTRFEKAGESAQTATLRYVGDCAALYDNPEQVIAEVAHLGTGFMLLTREMAEQMINAYPETRYRRIDAQQDGNVTSAPDDAHALFDCLIDPETRTYLSEDFAFCRRWRLIGGKAWLHRGIQLAHTGSTTFRGDMMLRSIPPAMFPS